MDNKTNLAEKENNIINDEFEELIQNSSNEFSKLIVRRDNNIIKQYLSLKNQVEDEAATYVKINKFLDYVSNKSVEDLKTILSKFKAESKYWDGIVSMRSSDSSVVQFLSAFISLFVIIDGFSNGIENFSFRDFKSTYVFICAIIIYIYVTVSSTNLIKHITTLQYYAYIESQLEFIIQKKENKN